MIPANQVDSYRYLDGITKRLVKSWIALEKPRTIPWTPLEKPLEECTIALISSAGLARKTDKPFDQEGEKKNPWWGDPSFRVLPHDTREEDIILYHLHINPALVEEDMNTVFPLPRLLELEENGEIGQVASRHYSYMGYILQPKVLLEESIPSMILRMKQDCVDAVLLVPG